MINYIVYSKDRASQLDLLLRSIDKYGNGQIGCHIIYKSSDDKFAAGYRKLFEQSESYKCLLSKIVETDFRNDTLHVVMMNPCKLFGFFTDDTVLFKPLPLNEEDILELMSEQRCYSFSLRNGINTELQCHYQPIYERLQLVYNKDNIIMWDTSKHPYDTDFGRPMSIDGNFFIYGELLRSLVEFPWNCPRTLDGINTDYIRPNMMAFRHSVAVNIPVNLTAGGYADNWGHFYQYSLEDMNDKFLANKIIDLDRLNCSKIESSHQERELFFI